MAAEPRALAGAVLCGGSSRRMGLDKARLEIDGTSLLERAVSRLRAVAEPIILAAGDHTVEFEGCLSVVDVAPRRGPLSGLVAALRVTPHRLCAVVAVDMPDLDPELLGQLAATWAGEDAVVPLSPRGAEPLHAVYATSARDRAEVALRSGEASLQALLVELRVGFVDVARLRGAAVAQRFAVNLNRPEDVMAWRRDRPAAASPPAEPPR